MKNSAGSTHDNKETTDTKARRQALLGAGIGILGIVATACGKTEFKSKRVETRVKPADSDVEPTATPKPPEPTPSPTPKCGSVGGQKDLSFESGFLASDIDLKDVTAKSLAIRSHALYGNRKSALLSLALNDLQVDDVIHVLKKETENDSIARLLASRRITAADRRPVVFDNLALSTAQGIEVVLVRGSKKTRATVSSSDKGFLSNFNGKKVVDVLTLDEKFSEFFPYVAYAGGVSAPQNAGLQRRQSRQLNVATDESNIPVTLRTASGGGKAPSKFHVRNSAGEEMPDIGPEVLKKDNMFVIYAESEEIYYRYFFILG